MKNELLLLEDVDGLGRSGDIVTAKPGYVRNFLLPKKKAVIAEKHLVRLRESLQKERSERATVDRKEAEALAKELGAKGLIIKVKIDVDGHMYGSVTGQDVAKCFEEQLNIEMDKKSILLPKPIRKLGVHEVELKLREGVSGKITLEIQPEKKAEA